MASPIDSSALVRQVRRNCDISDARHAGLYSICGLALRLRDLYKWQQGLNPWEEHDSKRVLAWIGDKEDLWEGLQETPYLEIAVNGKRFDPFDTLEINQVLSPHGIFYGAGYAFRLKPTFFLARIEKRETLHGYRVHTLGRELARDLLTLPAIAQDGGVLVRRHSARLYLWDQMTYLKKSGRPALKYALATCGVDDIQPQTLRHHLSTVFAAQHDTYVRHEIGELADTVFDVHLWREIVAAFPHSPIELFVRAVKDLLADTHPLGPLHHIVQGQRQTALGLYVAFIDGLSKELFPQIITGFERYVSGQNWDHIREAVSSGHETARRYADLIVDIYRTGRQEHDLQWTARQLNQRLFPSKEAGNGSRA